MRNTVILIIMFLYSMIICNVKAENISDIMQNANAGDAKSQYILATHYYNGSNYLEQNYNEAVKWLIKSAEQGYSKAQDVLGFCYWSGKGTNQDFVKAVYWYQKAANQDNANAQRNLAVCYKNGQGVSKDMKCAVDWFKKSAENGNIDSQLAYANQLLSGRYIPKDSVEACFWLYYSARGGNDYHHPKEECNQKAADLLKSMADNENSAIIAYAKYYHGKLCNVFDNYFEAEKYLYESYQLGCYDAAPELGYIYYNCDHAGGAIRTNTSDDVLIQKSRLNNQTEAEVTFRNRVHKYENDNAEYWFNEAFFRKLKDTDMLNWHLCNIYANNGDYKSAAISLERFFATGNYFNGPCEDYLRLADLYILSNYKVSRAFDIYKERYDAIETNANSDLNDNTWYDWIVCGLGKCYYMGVGVNRSYETAVKYFKMAADNDDPEAMQFLSRCYRFGRGVGRNTAMAESLLKKAESMDDPTALRIRSLLE